MEPKQKTDGLLPKAEKSKSLVHRQVKCVTLQSAQEIYRQTTEPQNAAPNEYAEQEAERFGQQAVTQIEASANYVQEKVRNAAISRLRSERTEAPQTESAYRQAENVHPRVTEDVMQSGPLKNNRIIEEPKTGIERDSKPVTGEEQPIRTEPAAGKRPAGSFHRKEGKTLHVEHQAQTPVCKTPETAQIHLSKPDPVSEHCIHAGDRRSAVSPKQRLLSGAAKEAHVPDKTAQHTVKQVGQTAKSTKEAAKAAHRSATAARKAAQASAKAAQAAKETSVKAAQATVKIGQAAYRALIAAIKAIVEGVKSLIAIIAEGGWAAVLVIAIIVIVAALCASAFGIFWSNDTEEGYPMTEAIREINDGFIDSVSARINRFKRQYAPDELELVYEGDSDSSGSVMNWPDVLGIYAVSTTTDLEQPTDVITVTPEKVETLRSIFSRMNSVTYKADLDTKEIQATDDGGNLLFDENGEPVMTTKTKLTITIRVASADYRDAANLYSFDENQCELLNRIMEPEFYPLYASLLGDVIGDGGEYGFGSGIQPDLPPNELGYRIVQAAKRYIGRSYASMDCSTLARTAYADVGLTSMKGLSSVRMALKCQEMGCLFTDPSMLQAGDLIFFARYDTKRGKDYCGDERHCGTGKCQRWMHIHHVAIYINDEYLIDSTGGDNSVQIRKHWGVDTAKWKWVFFGRPTT